MAPSVSELLQEEEAEEEKEPRWHLSLLTKKKKNSQATRRSPKPHGPAGSHTEDL